jgi:outer membrane protein
MWVVALLLAGFFVISSTAGWAAAAPKIGSFDLQVVLDQSKAGKEAKESFKDQKNKVKDEMEEKAKAFRTAKEELDKKKSVMDESTKNKKTKELAQMQQEGEKLIMEANAKLNKLSNELMAPIVDKVLEIVRKMGKDKKYDFIIEVGKGGIVYSNTEADLTKTVIEEMDKSVIKK